MAQLHVLCMSSLLLSCVVVPYHLHRIMHHCSYTITVRSIFRQDAIKQGQFIQQSFLTNKQHISISIQFANLCFYIRPLVTPATLGQQCKLLQRDSFATPVQYYAVRLWITGHKNPGIKVSSQCPVTILFVFIFFPVTLSCHKVVACLMVLCGFLADMLMTGLSQKIEGALIRIS